MPIEMYDNDAQIGEKRLVVTHATGTLGEAIPVQEIRRQDPPRAYLAEIIRNAQELGARVQSFERKVAELEARIAVLENNGWNRFMKWLTRIFKKA